MKALKNGQTYYNILSFAWINIVRFLMYVWPFFKAFIKPFEVPKRSENKNLC